MIPAQMDFPCWSNSDYMESIIVTDGGLPVDLTGLAVRMDVRLYPDGPLVFNPNITLNITDSTIDIIMDRTSLASAKLQSSRLSYDILMIYTDNYQEIYAQGVVSIDEGVTQNG